MAGANVGATSAASTLLQQIATASSQEAIAQAIASVGSVTELQAVGALAAVLPAEQAGVLARAADEMHRAAIIAAVHPSAPSTELEHAYDQARTDLGRLVSGISGVQDAATRAQAQLPRFADEGTAVALVRNLMGVGTLTITPAMVDFTNGTPAISGAQKFVVPVNISDGEALVYPEGATKDGVSIAGQRIVDYKEDPIGEFGVVFFNAKDGAWQAAVQGDGVVIMNQVTEAQAQKLLAKYTELGGPDMSFANLKAFLSYAAQEVGIGDMYNSDRSFIASKMTTAKGGEYVIDDGEGVFGFMKRDDRDIVRAVYVDQPFQFQGPAATAQQMPNGGVIVQQGKDVRAIQPDVFTQTYLHADGGKAIADLGTEVALFRP